MSFRFKQFTIDDSRCAMKVGTDAVILGVWADCGEDNTETRILDVGTGSGVIALMLAQRNTAARIEGIDIDEDAVAQARDNFAASPWHERLTVKKISLQEYCKAENGIYEGAYDIIVSNPPYFHNSLKAPDAKRSIARHTDTLQLTDLTSCSARMLKENGILAVIIPQQQEEELIMSAERNGMQLQRILRVQGRAERPVKRVVVILRKTTQRQEAREDTLVLEEGVNERTQAYKDLTQDFYL